MIQLTLTLKMTTAQVVETSVTVNNNSPIQDYVHPDDQTQPTFHFLYVYMWLKIIWHSRLPFSVVVGVSLTDLKWVGFSGSGTGWGICFMGTGLVHPLLEVRTKRTTFSDHGRAVTIEVLHKEIINFVIGIDEL